LFIWTNDDMFIPDCTIWQLWHELSHDQTRNKPGRRKKSSLFREAGHG